MFHLSKRKKFLPELERFRKEARKPFYHRALLGMVGFVIGSSVELLGNWDRCCDPQLGQASNLLLAVSPEEDQMPAKISQDHILGMELVD